LVQHKANFLKSSLGKLLNYSQIFSLVDWLPNLVHVRQATVFAAVIQNFDGAKVHLAENGSLED
jgi:hypothetical protein